MREARDLAPGKGGVNRRSAVCCRRGRKPVEIWMDRPDGIVVSQSQEMARRKPALKVRGCIERLHNGLEIPATYVKLTGA